MTESTNFITRLFLIIRCKFVVIAVPPREKLQFDIKPQPSANLQTIQASFEHGKNVFFTIHSDDLLWCNSTSNILIVLGDLKTNLKLAYNVSSSNRNTLQMAGYLSNQNFDSSAKLLLFDILNSYFNADIRCFTNYKDICLTPNHGGSPMSALKPGSFEAYINCMQEPHGR